MTDYKYWFCFVKLNFLDRIILCTYNMLKTILTNTYYKCNKASWVFYKVIQTSSNV